MAAKTELQDLVDNPNETLGAEYKGWLDLRTNAIDRANTARHIAALANHGGGYIIFGFTDEMEFAGANPFPNDTYDRDSVASIVKKYLEPAFQCDVHFVRSAASNSHPIIVVPPHGAVPICTKAGGPEFNGKPQGVISGTYYLRKPGPESAAIIGAAEWAPLMRRCAMSDRAAIIGALDAALRGGPLAANGADALKEWHDAARAVFLSDLQKYKGRPALANWHYQFSYAIDRADDQRLDPGSLLETIRQVNLVGRDLIDNIGWTMFYPFTRPGIEPHFAIDQASGQGEHDFLECALLRDPEGVNFPDMWRISTDGKATIVRNYWDDDADWAKLAGTPRGTLLSPQMMTRAVAEFVRHARGLAERFDAPTSVSFRCEWHGLSGRRFFDSQGRWSEHYISKSDHRVTTGAWPVGTLAKSWYEVVWQLVAPLFRAFAADWSGGPSWVYALSRGWRER